MITPVIPEKRRPLTRKQRLDAHDLHGGTCCVCQFPIAPGEPFIDEHIIPLELGGSNHPSNRGMAHVKCARKKTQRDQRMIAKAIRQRAKHVLPRKPSRFACSRNSEFKKKISGEVVRR
jgi:5-methylcytosine-specific restriction endonuclease McrA